MTKELWLLIEAYIDISISVRLHPHNPISRNLPILRERILKLIEDTRINDFKQW